MGWSCGLKLPKHLELTLHAGRMSSRLSRGQCSDNVWVLAVRNQSDMHRSEGIVKTAIGTTGESSEDLIHPIDYLMSSHFEIHSGGSPCCDPNIPYKLVAEVSG